MTHTTQISLVVCILASLILIGEEAFAQRPDTLREIVKFRGLDLTTPGGLATARSVVAGSKSNEVHLLRLINAMAIRLPAAGADQALVSLQKNPNVEQVFDDPLSVAAGVICITPAPPPVPESYPWGLEQIDVPAVHRQWQGSGVTVAVLDTGIDLPPPLDHPELRPRILGGYNARAGANPSAYQDDNGHGTHMAGIIAADLNSPLQAGIIGVVPQATLLAVKVLDQSGAGYLSDVINGLQWVHDYNNGSPLIINMSLGFSEGSPPLQEAIQTLYNSGVIMVASAGNRCAPSPGQEEGGGDCQGGPALACDPAQTAVKYPAAYDEVMAVAATDVNGKITAYSLLEPEVDVAAPGGSRATGVRILSSTTGGGYGWGSGTSQAAAHVSGAVALALDLRPGLSFEEVRLCLQATAEGPGRINVKKLVQALLVGHQC
jgi:subtilisin